MTDNLILDIKKNGHKTATALLLIVFLMIIIINQLSIENQKNEIKEKQSKFLKLEKKRFRNYFNYFKFAKEGIRIMAVSDPINVLFCDSNTFPGDLFSSFNSFEKLEINKQQKGIGSFENQIGGVLDFAWFILTIGSLIVMARGWLLFKNAEYLKFMTNFTGTKNVWGRVILKNISLIVLCLILLIIASGIQMLANGLWSSDMLMGLFSFLLVSILCLVALFLIASNLGFIKNNTLGMIILVSLFFLLLFVWPKIQNSVFYHNSQTEINKVYDNETKKMAIVTNFEREFINELGKYKTGQERKQANVNWMERFWNKEYKLIENLEAEIINKTEEIAKEFHFWSIFTPATFYKSVCNELSSRGYMSYISFYRDLQRKQRRFLRFYIDKRFYENNPKVEHFLKDDDSFFHLESSLPFYFISGLFFYLSLIVILLFVSYWLFRRYIFPLDRKDAFSHLSLELKKGKHFVYSYNTNDTNFPVQVYNVFSGKIKKFTGKISIDGESIVTNDKKKFVYLPVPNALPGNRKVEDLIKQVSGLPGISESEIRFLKSEFDGIIDKRFRKIDALDKVKLMLKLVSMKEPEIYFLNNFLIQIDREQDLIEIIERFKKEDILIVETNSSHVYHKRPDRFCKISLHKGTKYKETKITEK